MKETTLSVQGMKCDGCARTVEQKLRAVPGVTEVKVSVKDANAKATTQDQVTVTQLIDALKGTPYKAS